MIRLSKIWYWVAVVGFIILAGNITILFAQTSGPTGSKEANLSDNTNKGDAAAKVEIQAKDPAPRDATVGIDPAIAIEIQRRFNELERARLNNRSNYIDRWLTFIAIVLTFFGLVVVVLGYFGIRSFKELEADAKKYVEEIKEHRAQSEAHIGEMTSIDLSDPEKTAEVEKAVQDVRSDPEPSFIDKVLTEIYTLQRNSRVENAVEKWRSIANIAEETDNELAARAWLSIAYLLPEGDDRLAAYEKAMDLDPNYTRSPRNQPMSEYSERFHEHIVVNAVLRYFNSPKFEKFSTLQEHNIGSDSHRIRIVDVALLDRSKRLVAIAECKRSGYMGKRWLAQLTEYCRQGDVQFGLFAADTDPSKWTFLRILEDRIIEITRSRFEEELVESGSS